MDTTLVIMAAGLGSRYEGGIKQLAKVGPSGEIIMDYSIYDAIAAGFNKIIFVIRKDIEKDFIEIIGNRISKVCKTEYVFQELGNVPEKYKFKVSPDRRKPWGTGQAVLACKDIINEPFAVINADDFYGREPFEIIHNFLVNEKNDGDKEKVCLPGFILKNTLSDNGAVTRGICLCDEDNKVHHIIETKNIIKTEDGAAEQTRECEICALNPDSHVSMNMWGFMPSFLDKLEDKFYDFFAKLEPYELKKEYLLPNIIDSMIKRGECEVSMTETDSKWFGMTYKPDLPVVCAEIKKLTDSGAYPTDIMAALLNKN